MSEQYDRSRSVNKLIFPRVIKFILQKFPPDKYKRLFEPGIGSGRIAVPLSGKGYSITGIDISDEMLDILGKRIKSLNITGITFLKSDATMIPFKDRSFDIGIIVHRKG